MLQSVIYTLLVTSCCFAQVDPSHKDPFAPDYVDETWTRISLLQKSELSGDLTPEFVRTSLASKFVIERKAALVWIGRTRAHAFTPDVARCIHDDIESVRQLALRTLLVVGDPNAKPIILETLGNMPDVENSSRNTRRALADMLAYRGLPSELALLNMSQRKQWLTEFDQKNFRNEHAFPMLKIAGERGNFFSYDLLPNEPQNKIGDSNLYPTLSLPHSVLHDRKFSLFVALPTRSIKVNNDARIRWSRSRSVKPTDPFFKQRFSESPVFTLKGPPARELKFALLFSHQLERGDVDLYPGIYQFEIEDTHELFFIKLQRSKEQERKCRELLGLLPDLAAVRELGHLKYAAAFEKITELFPKLDDCKKATVADALCAIGDPRAVRMMLDQVDFRCQDSGWDAWSLLRQYDLDDNAEYERRILDWRNTLTERQNEIAQLTTDEQNRAFDAVRTRINSLRASLALIERPLKDDTATAALAMIDYLADEGPITHMVQDYLVISTIHALCDGDKTRWLELLAKFDISIESLPNWFAALHNELSPQREALRKEISLALEQSVKGKSDVDVSTTKEIEAEPSLAFYSGSGMGGVPSRESISGFGGTHFFGPLNQLVRINGADQTRSHIVPARPIANWIVLDSNRVLVVGVDQSMAIYSWNNSEPESMLEAANLWLPAKNDEESDDRRDFVVTNNDKYLVVHHGARVQVFDLNPLKLCFEWRSEDWLQHLDPIQPPTDPDNPFSPTPGMSRTPLMKPELIVESTLLAHIVDQELRKTHLVAIDLNNGNTRWKSKNVSEHEFVMPLDRDKVIRVAYQKTGWIFAAFSLQDGKEVWRNAIENAVLWEGKASLSTVSQYNQYAYTIFSQPKVLQHKGQLIVVKKNRLTSVELSNGTVAWDAPFAEETELENLMVELTPIQNGILCSGKSNATADKPNQYAFHRLLQKDGHMSEVAEAVALQEIHNYRLNAPQLRLCR